MTFHPYGYPHNYPPGPGRHPAGPDSEEVDPGLREKFTAVFCAKQSETAAMESGGSSRSPEIQIEGTARKRATKPIGAPKLKDKSTEAAESKDKFTAREEAIQRAKREVQ